MKLQDVVTYHGPVSNQEIARAIGTIDLGIIPNRKGPFTDLNFPVRIFEYLALNKPVIVPRTPGILDYFDENNMHFFEAGNVDSPSEKAQGPMWLRRHGERRHHRNSRGAWPQAGDAPDRERISHQN